MSQKNRKIINISIDEEFFYDDEIKTWEPPYGWNIVQIFPYKDSFIGADRLIVLLEEETVSEPLNEKKKL